MDLGLLLESAILLAALNHHGQTDKAGRPYILHPLRVLAAFKDPEDDEARIVAVLHDLIEDTEITLASLRLAGFPEVCVQAIDSLSRRSGEPYPDYILRCGDNPLAARVKIADLQDNLDPARPSTALLRDSRLRLYRKALVHLASLIAYPASEPR